MQSLLNPRWLFIINSVPVVILFLVHYGAYNIIESQLSTESTLLWVKFGIALALLWIFHIVFAVWLITRKQLLTWMYGITALLLYIPFIYFYQMSFDKLIPRSIPPWMLSEDMFWYTGSFLMPTLAHALLVAMLHLTSRAENRRPWMSFLAAVSIPTSWYLFFQFILPLWKRVEKSFNEHVIIVLMITSVVLFLFFLIRVVYILSVKRTGLLKRYHLAWKILFAICLPLAGLYVNNTKEWFSFGDFSSWWFYSLAAINGVAICSPSLDHSTYRLTLFVLRSITFTFILYFFIVFLPYLPLSVIAVIAAGVGFLMLTPLIVMIIQTKTLADDFTYLKNRYSEKSIIAMFIASAMVLPLGITWSYMNDERTLNKALAYVYEPDYSQQRDTKLSVSHLENVLEHVRKNKGTRRSFGRQTPFLSSYYNWLVLDNLTLSEQRMGQLERIFFGKPTAPPSPTNANNPNENVSISNTSVASVYDYSQRAWKSTVELEIKNENTFQAEYVTTFRLPEGTWINNYFLWIEDEKVQGILAEKKAATWVYQRITSFRRDPGILHYITGNTIAFRVFPFEAMQTRRTSFELLHKEPATFNIDGHAITLGNDSKEKLKGELISADGHVVYIPTEVKNSLPIVKRKPHFHFLIDCSAGKKDQAETFNTMVQRFVKQQNINSSACTFTLVNTYSIPQKNLSDLPAALNSVDYKGGFFIDRAIEKILFNAVNTASDTYPVMIVVTDSVTNAFVRNDFSDFNNAFPESDHFFLLDDAGNLVPHSLVKNPSTPMAHPVDISNTHDVVAWPNAAHPQAYLRRNGEPSIILRTTSISPTANSGQPNDWSTGLALHGQWLSHVLHPEKSDETWRPLARNSFGAHIMTPVTAFIAVENEAQRKVLLKKQEQVLNARKSLDLGEETRMSEPGMLIIVLGVGLVLVFYKMAYPLKKIKSFNN